MDTSRQAGFSLIELMIVISIAAILLGLGVPSFQHFVVQGRVTAQTNDFATALNLARSEAVRRGTWVNIEATNGTAWDGGWRVYVDADRSGDFNAGDTELRVHAAASNNITIRGSANVTDLVSYRPNGASDQTGVIRVCHPSGNADNARRITISTGGRINTVRITEANCSSNVIP